jgi:hypothetical protein
MSIEKISFESFGSFSDQNRAQITSDKSNDISNDISNDTLDEDRISFDESPQNHAQNGSPNGII